MSSERMPLYKVRPDPRAESKLQSTCGALRENDPDRTFAPLGPPARGLLQRGSTAHGAPGRCPGRGRSPTDDGAGLDPSHAEVALGLPGILGRESDADRARKGQEFSLALERDARRGALRIRLAQPVRDVALLEDAVGQKKLAAGGDEGAERALGRARGLHALAPPVEGAALATDGRARRAVEALRVGGNDGEGERQRRAGGRAAVSPEEEGAGDDEPAGGQQPIAPRGRARG